MKYNGYIFHRVKLCGKIFKRINLIAKVETRELFGKVGIHPRILFKGSMQARPGRSGFIKWLDVRYAFISAVSMIVTKCKSALSTGKAKEVKADTAVRTGKEAQLAAHPAQNLAVNQQERLTVLARLVAYRRAGLAYIRRLFFHLKAALAVSLAAEAEYREEIRLGLEAKAAAAGSAIMESRENTVATGSKAAGAAAQGATVPGVSLAMTATHKAQAGKAAVTGANINNAFRAVHRVSLATWFSPEQGGNALHLFQAFSGIQSGNVLELDMEETSAFWANATAQNGVLHLVFAETATPAGNSLEVV